MHVHVRVSIPPTASLIVDFAMRRFMTYMLSINSCANLRVIFAILNIQLQLDLIVHYIILDGAKILRIFFSASR